MNDSLKVSIITPNYNYDKYIGKTIESVVGQPYGNIEHIIVDDGSTDDSIDVISNFKSQYPKKIKLVQQQNKGQAAALNSALKFVDGDIIGWINSDDYYVSGVFSDVIEIFKNNLDIDVVFGDYFIVDIRGNYISSKRNLRFKYFEGVFIGFGNILTSNTVFWRKNIMEEIGIFNENLLSNMDGEFFSRLTYKKKVYKINQPIANFRKQLVSKAGIQRDDWNTIVRKEREFEFANSFKNLLISRIIPINIAKNIKYFLLLYRKVLKLGNK